MLEKPDLADARIIACLRDAYGIDAAAVTFLPLGADRDTAVYRAAAADGTPYFVKLRSSLRRGDFDETTVAVPRLLHEQGVEAVIAPLLTRAGDLWAGLDTFKLTVSPFIAGQDGYEVALTDAHWIELGRALKGLHTATLPPALASRLPRETYAATWREIVRGFQARVETATFTDPAAVALAALLRENADVVSRLVSRAETLAAAIGERPFVPCHADIHAGNVLITPGGRLYVVDWDTLLLAPKERDLMFIGGGLFAGWRAAQEEEALFYAGYGQTTIDPVALVYYRYERIVQDIAAYSEQLLLTDAGGADRENSLRQIMSQFLPGGVIGYAFQSEAALPPTLQI